MAGCWVVLAAAVILMDGVARSHGAHADADHDADTGPLRDLMLSALACGTRGGNLSAGNESRPSPCWLPPGPAAGEALAAGMGRAGVRAALANNFAAQDRMRQLDDAPSQLRLAQHRRQLHASVLDGINPDPLLEGARGRRGGSASSAGAGVDADAAAAAAKLTPGWAMFTSGGCNHSAANVATRRPEPFQSCEWITELAECVTAVAELGLDSLRGNARLYSLGVAKDSPRGCSFRPKASRTGIKVAFNPDTANTACSGQKHCICRCRPQVLAQSPQVCGGVPVLPPHQPNVYLDDLRKLTAASGRDGCKCNGGKDHLGYGDSCKEWPDPGTSRLDLTAAFDALRVTGSRWWLFPPAMSSTWCYVDRATCPEVSTLANPLGPVL